jgi:hypothetical protein
MDRSQTAPARPRLDRHDAEDASQGARGEVAATGCGDESGSLTRVQCERKPRRPWTPEDWSAREEWSPLVKAASALHPSGEKGVAEIVGVSKTYWQAVCDSEDTATADMRDLARIRRRAPTVFRELLKSWLAATAPAPCTPHDTFRAFLSVASESGDVSRAFERAMANRRIDPEDVAPLCEQADEAIAALEGFKVAVRDAAKGVR